MTQTVYPGTQRGKNLSMAPVPSSLMHALYFQVKHRGGQSYFLRLPCCKIREASRQKMENDSYLAHTLSAVLSSIVQLQLSEDG